MDHCFVFVSSINHHRDHLTSLSGTKDRAASIMRCANSLFLLALQMIRRSKGPPCRSHSTRRHLSRAASCRVHTSGEIESGTRSGVKEGASVPLTKHQHEYITFASVPRAAYRFAAAMAMGRRRRTIQPACSGWTLTHTHLVHPVSLFYDVIFLAISQRLH